MSHKKWVVTLQSEERTFLLEVIKKGKTGGRRLNRAHILLLADEGQTDETIAKALHTGLSTVIRTRQRLVEGGLEYALSEATRRQRPTKLDGKGRALLVATACSTPPKGRMTWTMQLLANRLVELQVVDSLSDETVRQELKKVNLSPGRRRSGASRKSAASS
jgi:transposase